MLLCTLLVLRILAVMGFSPMEVLFQWRQMYFEIPHNAKYDGRFPPSYTLPLDVDTTSNVQRIFVTTPSFLKGFPVTLSTLVPDNYGGNYLLRPYPDWRWTGGGCDGLVSVLRIKIDNCGRLWALDSGMVDIMGSYTRACQPKLVVFDLKTDTPVFTYIIPEDQLKPFSLLDTVEVHGDCTNTFGFLGDIAGFGLIVVDMSKKESWRIENKYFEADNCSSHIIISGTDFNQTDGVISLAISKDLLYFHSTASRYEYTVPLSLLEDKNNFQNPGDNLDSFTQLPGPRPGESGPAAFAFRGDVMLFSVLPENALYCWNTKTQYVSENMHRVYKDDTTFQFPSGLKVISDEKGQEFVWILTSRFQQFYRGKLNPKDVNFRIMVAPVYDLIANTPCAIP